MLLFFVTLPPVLWELTARSDFGTNVLLVTTLLTLGALRNRGKRATGRELLITSLLAGLLLSTRLVLLFPYLLLSPLLVGRSRLPLFLVLTGVTVGATLLPFYLWDPQQFLACNPLLLNSKAPLWASVSALLLALLGSFLRLECGGRLIFAGWLALAVVAVPFVLTLQEFSLAGVISGTSGFDFFYFHTGILLIFLGLVVQRQEAARPSAPA